MLSQWKLAVLASFFQWCNYSRSSHLIPVDRQQTRRVFNFLICCMMWTFQIYPNEAMALNWMKQIRKARQFSCEILLAYRKNLQSCLHSRKREDPEQWRCWKLYYLFKSREARVYMFTPLSSSTLQILKLCCAQSLEFTDIKEQECRHDRSLLCSII